MRIQLAPESAQSGHVYGGKPDWLKIRPPTEKFTELRELVAHFGLHTVCEEAHCPNMSECWSGGTATFMVLGDTCTRGCKFCAIKTGNPKGQLNAAEPRMLAECVREMNALDSNRMDYIVITSVDRDDLPDQGAAHFASCIGEVKAAVPGIMVEVLTPDFRGSRPTATRKPSSGAAPGAVTCTSDFAIAAAKSVAARFAADRTTGSRMVSSATAAKSCSFEPK